MDVRIATEREELARAYRMVYRLYLAAGYIQPNPGKVVYHQQFGCPSSRTIVAAPEGDGVVGTLTVVGDNPLGLQLEATYPAEVSNLREQSRRIAEITCLGVETGSVTKQQGVFFELTRFMIHYAYSRDFDDLLLAIHPKRYKFYWQHFRVYPLGPRRPHQAVCGNPSVACRIDLHALRRNVDAELWQQYFARGFPAIEYTKPPISLADHYHFLACRGTSESGDWQRDAA